MENPTLFLEAAEAELAEIERKLVDIVPLKERRDQLRAFIAMGHSLWGTKPATAIEVPSQPKAERRPITEPGTTKAQILVRTEQIIATEGPIETRHLVARLQAAGVEIGGADKVLSVSSVLSRAKDKFKSDRAAGGWTLVHPHKEETPSGAPTPEGA